MFMNFLTNIIKNNCNFMHHHGCCIYPKRVAIFKDCDGDSVQNQAYDVSDSLYTVNSEVFARVLFLRNFALAKFRINKILAK